MSKKTPTLLILLALLICNHSCTKSRQLTDDRDGRKYHIEKIGDQWWMTQNLAYLPFVTQKSAPDGIWVPGFEGVESRVAKWHGNYETFGCLYSWKVALEICPDGWHLPSNEEWIALEKSLDRDNTKNFDIPLAGMRYFSGHFHKFEEIGYYWTASEMYENSAWYRCKYADTDSLHRGYPDKKNGFSVRCVKDSD